MSELTTLLEALTRGDDELAERAVADLAGRAPTAVEPLLEWCESPDSERRWWATRALAAIDHPLVWEALQRALDDPDPAVRQCAAVALAERPSPQAIPALVSALADADRLTARLAGNALIAVGVLAIPALTQALASPDAAVRIEAARALALIQNRQAVPALFSVLDDPSAIVVHWAELGLQRLGVGMVFFKPS